MHGGMHRSLSRIPLGALLIGASLLGCDPDPGDPGPEEVVFDGPSAEVRVVRDGIGVPHIFGATDADVLYGAGYAQAQDRLIQMALMRRQALGRLAEVAGEGQLDSDRAIRTIGIHLQGMANEIRMREQDPEGYLLLVAWTAGVNAFIDEVRSGARPLPAGFGPEGLDFLPERWAPSDGLAVGKLILFGNSATIEYEIFSTILHRYLGGVDEILDDVPNRQLFILPEEERSDSPPGPEAASDPEAASARAGAESFASRLPADAAERMRRFAARWDGARGSNNWAVAGRHTENGQPLIAGDPHQGLGSPAVVWLHHMSSAEEGGSLDVIGFGFAGTPGVHLGHNRSVAWTATNAFADTMDMWELTVRGELAVVGDREVPIESRVETIEVRGGEPVELTVRAVPGYGVILPDGIAPVPVTGPGRSLMLRWTGLESSGEASAFFRFDRAARVEDMEAARDDLEIGTFALVAADRDAIRYFVPCRIPARDVTDPRMTGVPAPEPWRVMDASDPRSLWGSGSLSEAQMPRSSADARGWISTSNNDPFGFSQDGRAVGDPYYYGMIFDVGNRGARIEGELERLAARGGATLEEMKALQLDDHQVFADDLVPLAEEAYAASEGVAELAELRDAPGVAELVAQLSGWDRRMAREASAPLAFHLFSHLLTEEVLRDDYGLFFESNMASLSVFLVRYATLALRGVYPRSDELLQGGRDRILLAALARTAGLLIERYGSVGEGAYVWGDAHRSRIRNGLLPGLLDTEATPLSGSPGTVNVAYSRFYGEGLVPNESFGATTGPVYRMVAGFDEAGVPQAEVSMAAGNVADPSSPFFQDRLAPWSAGEYEPLLFDREAIEAAATETITLPAAQ